ncbi:hypothetical protein F8388_000833 [Cannabis sativa]|uniref:Uncharacterized protein n=1 Tax=Cannabis sativa TaxID=3483 RepID=A0A7J6EQ14_CANSA|nr:hypothetical protein F8388_000833 [Cannabis sativa]
MAYRGAPLGPPPMAAAASSSASTVRQGETSISPICGGVVAFCALAGGVDAAPAAAAESKMEEKVEEIEESDEV